INIHGISELVRHQLLNRLFRRFWFFLSELDRPPFSWPIYCLSPVATALPPLLQALASAHPWDPSTTAPTISTAPTTAVIPAFAILLLMRSSFCSFFGNERYPRCLSISLTPHTIYTNPAVKIPKT